MGSSSGVFQLCLLLYVSSLGFSRQHFNIYWNSSNEIFRIDNTDHVFTARIRDKVDIHCPLYNDTVLEEETEGAIIYRVSKYGYDNCILDGRQLIVGRCSSPYVKSLITIIVREFSPGILEFAPGESYYFISTSDGSKAGIMNEEGGLCRERNMKIRFDILPTEKSRSRSSSQAGYRRTTTTSGHFSPRWRHKVPGVTKPEMSNRPVSSTVVPDLSEFFQKLNQETEDFPRRSSSNHGAPFNEGPNWWSPNSAPSSSESDLFDKDSASPFYEIHPQAGEDENQLVNTRYWGLSDQGRDSAFDAAPTRQQLVLYSVEEVDDTRHPSNSGSSVDIRWISTFCLFLVFFVLLVNSVC